MADRGETGYGGVQADSEIVARLARMREQAQASRRRGPQTIMRNNERLPTSHSSHTMRSPMTASSAKFTSSASHSHVEDEMDDFEDQLDAAGDEIQMERSETAKALHSKLQGLGVKSIVDATPDSPTSRTSSALSVTGRAGSYTERSKSPPASLNLASWDRLDFVTRPAPDVGSFHCRIQRGANKMYPVFQLVLEQDNTFLLAARKRKQKKCSHYVVSLDQDDTSRHGTNFLAKVRSNFVGTEFTIFDRGEKPSKATSVIDLRQHLGVVIYETNLFGSKGPRKMKVAVPAVHGGDPYTWRPSGVDPSGDLLTRYKSGAHDNMLVLHNKEPVWNPTIRAFVLNFNGRVTKSSVKNFQLVAEDDPERVLLQFGKTSKTEFTLDFRYPLTAVQAFSIVLSSFDHKLACE